MAQLFSRGRSNYEGSSLEIESGKLHLIVCTTDEDYDAWSTGTKILTDVAPVTSEQAAKALSRIRAGFC